MGKAERAKGARFEREVAAAPCRYGGARLWFRCPGCGHRRGTLYQVGGAGRCRRCHALLYRRQATRSAL